MGLLCTLLKLARFFIGSVKCSQGGHYLTNKLLKEVFNDSDNYSLIEIKGKQLPHTFTNYQNLKSIA